MHHNSGIEPFLGSSASAGTSVDANSNFNFNLRPTTGVNPMIHPGHSAQSHGAMPNIKLSRVQPERILLSKAQAGFQDHLQRLQFQQGMRPQFTPISLQQSLPHTSDVPYLGGMNNSFAAQRPNMFPIAKMKPRNMTPLHNGPSVKQEVDGDQHLSHATHHASSTMDMTPSSSTIGSAPMQFNAPPLGDPANSCLTNNQFAGRLFGPTQNSVSASNLLRMQQQMQQSISVPPQQQLSNSIPPHLAQGALAQRQLDYNCIQNFQMSDRNVQPIPNHNHPQICSTASAAFHQANSLNNQTRNLQSKFPKIDNNLQNHLANISPNASPVSDTIRQPLNIQQRPQIPGTNGMQQKYGDSRNVAPVKMQSLLSDSSSTAATGTSNEKGDAPSWTYFTISGLKSGKSMKKPSFTVPAESITSATSLLASARKFASLESSDLISKVQEPDGSLEYHYTECSLKGVLDLNKFESVLPSDSADSTLKQLVELLRGSSDHDMVVVWKDESWRATGASESLNYARMNQEVAREVWVRRYYEPAHLRHLVCLRSYSQEHQVVRANFPTNARRVCEATASESALGLLKLMGFRRHPTSDAFVKCHMFHSRSGTAENVITLLQKFYRNSQFSQEAYPGQLVVEVKGRQTDDTPLDRIKDRVLEFSNKLAPHVSLMKL